MLWAVKISRQTDRLIGADDNLCSGSPGNERAGDNQNHLNDLNDELALLIGIERLDQLRDSLLRTSLSYK